MSMKHGGLALTVSLRKGANETLLLPGVAMAMLIGLKGLLVLPGRRGPVIYITSLSVGMCLADLPLVRTINLWDTSMLAVMHLCGKGSSRTAWLSVMQGCEVTLVSKHCKTFISNYKLKATGQNYDFYPRVSRHF